MTSPEFGLLTAAARWPASRARDGAVAAALDRPIDWGEFRGLARRHRLAGVVRQCLGAVWPQVPKDAAVVLDRDATTMSVANLHRSAETVRLVRRLEDAGLAVLCLKGLAVSMLAYGDPAIRHAKDIDLLVRPESVRDAAALLEQHGYTSGRPPSSFTGAQWRGWLREFHHVTYRQERVGTEVELHWRLFRNGALLPGVPAAGERAAVTLPDGSSLPTLAPADLFLYLSAHGAIHNWFRLKWVADIAALVSASPERTDEWYEAAVARGGRRLAGDGLRLAHELLAAPIGDALAARVKALPGAARLRRRALTALTSPAYRAEPDQWRRAARIAYEWDAIRIGGWRVVGRQIGILLVSADDARAMPLPAPARALYALARGPRWLWRRARSLTRS